MLSRFCALFPLALIAPLPALAQAPQTAGAPVDRVGPEAPTLAQPAYPEPPAAPLLAPPPAAPSPVAPDGSMLLTSIAISADPAARPAMPASDWQPNADGASGIMLEHAKGAPLDAAWIKAQFAANHLIGTDAGFDRITALVQLINLAFVNNGYPNTGVLIEGRSENGILELRLVSGRLIAAPGSDNLVMVSFRGGNARGLDADYVRHRLPSALADPLNIRQIERDFRLLSDDPAIRTVNASLLPGARPGEASLALDVVPQPQVDVFTTYANNRSPSVGARRLAVGASIRSWHQAGDLLSVQYGTTQGLTDFSGSYSAPLFSPRWMLAVRGGFNNASVVDRPLVPLDIRSKEYYFEGGLSRTLLARPLMPGSGAGRWQPAVSAVLGALLVHRQVNSSLLGTPFSFSPGSRDGRTEYDAARLTFDYTRRSVNTVFAASFTASHGLGGTRSVPAGAVTPSPFFTAMQLQLNYARRISPKLLELRLRFAGQVASGLLYSPERFSIGGSDTVRGYRESLLLADEAGVGSIELAQPFDLARRRGGASAFRWGAFTISAFADGALARNRVAPQPLPKAIASVGGRLAWTPADWLSGSVTFGQALRQVVVAGSTDLQDRGFSFQLTVHPIGLAHAIGGAF
ncbi:ShlB/FhaC/HecB family hemolysin secretion/activation protein [Novosphingobium sp.]|uniref:ShlB/FhaC/HecB family hemolysin secretion/activation protein n=1 Tax=Novosphingobium sp. TaxID=1874826 RepID=UPI003BAC91B6